MSQLIRKQPPVTPVEKVTIPEASHMYLLNGIPVHLIEAGTEDIMRVEFTFGAGQIKEDRPLLASTTNMMLSEGSENYSSEELNRILDFHGAYLNMSVDKDRAGIVMFLLNKHIKKVLELSREILFRPLFPEAELSSLLKKRLRWFLVNREKVQNITADKFFESIFGKGHPYGSNINEKDFDNLNREILREFHLKEYTPENLTIIISGKIHKDTLNLLNQYFGSIKTGTLRQENSIKLPPGEVEKKIFITKKDAVQSSIKIGSATINKLHPDYPGLKVLDSVLGGYFSSRLMKNIREDKGYTYGISSSVSSLNLSGYKVISTEVSKKHYRKTLDEIYKEIHILQTHTIEKDELEVVRNYMSGEMLRMFDGPFALAESFRSVWEFGLDNNYYNKLAETIKTITPDEIIKLTKTYYKIEDLYEIIAGEK